MIVVLVVRAIDPERTGIHRWHNFAEDVWAEHRGDRRIEMDLDQIDGPQFSFGAKLRSALEDRFLQAVDRIARKHLMGDEVVVQRR
ncbi:MAG: hypothetical protein AAFR84_03100 [Pseudomonadota bacterium]